MNFDHVLGLLTLVAVKSVNLEILKLIYISNSDMDKSKFNKVTTMMVKVGLINVFQRLTIKLPKKKKKRNKKWGGK